MHRKLVLNFGFKNSIINIGEKPLFEKISNGDSLYVFDSTTYSLFRELILGNSSGYGRIKAERIAVIEPGEVNKIWRSVELIIKEAFKNGLSRDSAFLGIGGGVVCDLTAFAASVFMRGCRLMLVPTTLLAMADAAIGGKTGFDFYGLKNAVGSFYPADEVYIFTDTLKTLSDREYMSGLAEVIKTAMLGDEELFEILARDRDKVLARESDLMSEIVERCIRVKGKIVEDDLREKGKRAVLNLGHTFGHALESVTGFRSITHGEGVAWGLSMALKLGVFLGITEADYEKEVLALLKLYNYRLKFDTINSEKLLKAMKGDKKKRKGKIRFIIQNNLGITKIIAMEEDTVLGFLSV
ncbi:MAG: 3-dehydroquinate synthase [Spirochaetales bacterium]|nr:3-dehydroquinate synthase [Spirochaetales bacterium]